VVEGSSRNQGETPPTRACAAAVEGTRAPPGPPDTTWRRGRHIIEPTKSATQIHLAEELGSGKSAGEQSDDGGVITDGSWFGKKYAKTLGPKHSDAADGERASDKGPVGIEVDLLEHSVYELRTVSSANRQSVVTRPEESAFDLQSGATLVPLGVDDPHAVCSHGDVVDVRACTPDAPVV
jgi:hypothetical protein